METGIRTLLYPVGEYRYLADRVLGIRSSASLGKLVEHRFPDGECHHRLADDVEGCHAVIIGGTIDDRHTLDLWDLACACAKHRAAKLTLIVPYYGYSTMERAAREGEVVKAKTRARLLSAIPQAPGGNSIILVELHVAGLAHYFEGNLLAHPVQIRERLVAKAREIAGGGEVVLASADSGRVKTVEALANKLHLSAAFALKERVSPTETKIVANSQNVAGKTILLFDDMIRTGNSLIAAAKAYREAGAGRIVAVATHGVLPLHAFNDLRGVKLFDAIVTADTHPRAVHLSRTPAAQDFLHIVSCDEAVAACL